MNESVDSTLLAEREHLERSRTALGHMRARTDAIADNTGDELTAWALGRLRRQRLADLADRPDVPLFFGRIWFPGEDFHIGRRHIVDSHGNPMVLDWRAPLSRAFYQASVRKPMDVTLRRRFGFGEVHDAEHKDHAALTGFEDEHLDAGDERGEASAILATEIERPRVGPMRDIVATIQPEQDDLVRADLSTTICVQGAPGTGKTAVGLHRAAYLLYAFAEQLRRNGVLIIGPNTAFMSYIDNVLPTLGEVDVTQLAVDELTDTVVTRGHDAIDTARVKHDERMATVLHRAVWGHVRLPEDSLMVAEGSWRWRLGTEYLRRAVSEARGDGIPYLVGRERVRAQIVAGLRRQVELRSGDSPGEAWTRRMGRHKLVKTFLDEVWPDLDAKRLLAKLLTDTQFRADCCAGVLTDAERDLLASRTKTPRYTRADAVLIDEIAGLLQRPAGFGHVVVDEAQDLSAMQCRAIARRSSHGSITVLGDLAQGTSPWTAADWSRSLAHLGKPDGEVIALTTGFRVPAAVLALANRLLPSLNVDVPAARSLRSDGLLEIEESTDLEADVATAVRAALGHEGSIGVIAADAGIAKLRDRLGETERVELVPASLAKGLEFDHVIVAEPADIVAAELLGLRRLYVVLTRAVSRLTVVHAKPLPAELGP